MRHRRGTEPAAVTGTTAGYSRPFVERYGVQLLYDGEFEVHVAAWKRLAKETKLLLAGLHGKRVIVHRQARPTNHQPLWSEASSVTGGEDTSILRVRNLTLADRVLVDMLGGACARGASDCSMWFHESHQWLVGERRRGQLHIMNTLPDPMARQIIRRLASRAGLDMLDETSPQDGMLRVPGVSRHRLRVSLLGAGSRRIASIRILSRAVPQLPALGYSASDIGLFIEALKQHSGLILFSGQTGSGKTTGIAACISMAAGTGRKIISIEDPVEYEIPGIVQIERRNGVGGSLIAATMRQDPDIIVLGETRSPEHAQQLQSAVESGHLVVSSVHARGSRGVEERLSHLGMAPGFLARHGLLLSDQCLTAGVLSARVRRIPWMEADR